MFRRLVGIVLAATGVVLIVLAFATAQSHCPSTSQNETGAPTSACAAYSWNSLSLVEVGDGIALAAAGVVIALYPRARGRP